MGWLALLLAPTNTFAQESRQQRFERIETEKIAFITKELDLSSREAQRFFPTYNEYRKELHATLQDNRRKSQQKPHRKTPILWEWPSPDLLSKFRGRRRRDKRRSKRSKS